MTIIVQISSGGVTPPHSIKRGSKNMRMIYFVVDLILIGLLVVFALYWYYKGKKGGEKDES